MKGKEINHIFFSGFDYFHMLSFEIKTMPVSVGNKSSITSTMEYLSLCF